MKDLYFSRRVLFLFLAIASLSALGFATLIIPRVNAQEMTSQNFRIQGGNFNMTSGNKGSTNFKLSDVVGQTAANIFIAKGFIIRSGFLNGAASDFFSFTLTPTVIDFGMLSPNAPVEQNVRITISNGNMPGYRVSAAENQPLSTAVGAEIPDTACDQEIKRSCTQSSASRWTQNSTYGFGYRVSGKTVTEDLSRETFYRPFPATRRNEKPSLILQSKAKKVTDQATVFFKVNVNTNQPVGQYRNVVTFTAVGGI